MSQFTRFNARALVVPHPYASEKLGKPYWVVLEEFTYFIESVESGKHVRIPKGFLTDGASVPKIFHNFLPPWGEYGQAAIVHDYMCENGRYHVPAGSGEEGKYDFEFTTRKQVDEIFNEAMVVLNVPSFKRKMINSAVSAYRIFAKPSCPNFNNPKREVEKEIRERIKENKPMVW